MDFSDTSVAKKIIRIIYGIFLLFGIGTAIVMAILKKENYTLEPIADAFFFMAFLEAIPMVDILQEEEASTVHIVIARIFKWISIFALIIFTMYEGLSLGGERDNVFQIMNTSSYGDSRPAFIIGVSAISSLALTFIVKTWDAYNEWANGDNLSTIYGDYGFLVGLVIFIPFYFLFQLFIPLAALVQFVCIALALIAILQMIAYSGSSILWKIVAFIFLIIVIIYNSTMLGHINDGKYFVNIWDHAWKNYNFFQVLEYSLFVYPYICAGLIIILRVLRWVHEEFGDEIGFYLMFGIPLFSIFMSIGFVYLLIPAITVLGVVIVAFIIIGMIL